jgi:adenylate cyclase
MAKLIVQGSEGRREYELGAVTTIGRHPDNAIQILDRIVSKEHAQIIKQPNGKFLYRDLGSLNGSFFANERISERLLVDGDEMLLGSTQVQFKEKNTESVVQQVTIEPAPSETLIRQKLAAGPRSREFLPEKEIHDVEALRRDYEKLRLAQELGRSIGLEVNLDVLLEKIIMKAFELIPADRGVILLMEDGIPKPRIARTRDGRSEQIVLSR